ncbi:hypothetical protein UFOVP958_45 [uncultured Caudovirales phage]|uniref:Uncharacterized protein n=1 Tax=uncultured Caudovirales phage TaxID=2100421 RepID=A0A6J5RGD6_9CAUD|nr:hypothetical protein UFOVP644_33 [uncultured Caudovirales phage]CAB4174365.1 hypothetical protein UFOVP958_45 [uncultured Caudovirales phage]CAB4192621.1 hypothetical protein UFOVP1232_47 [uncultured Caudovirales phage]CAB5230467.1 hypothetical protein UFOVP1572_14 [uncultured Caudovirales phage]
MNLKRYYISGLRPHIWEHPEGEMVYFEDYVTLWAENARLKAEVERLRKAGDDMASSIQFNEEMEKDYDGPTIVHPSVERWNAAKEGKQS